ncbi:hypothetical protein [Oceanobacillus bengalensis]|uniref:Phospholipid phosphatase n=1 Tax=Oceanobacillus bengalensis TaxID=1435466 RepID=A0A494Z930_9BACI|nr:hypothetical protein [Oceanobacillus bengalensis]RKQ18569.1 hypothetical protein D8M05_00185 [Oceanobacillus bengalensis]
MDTFLYFFLGFGYVCLFIWGLTLSRNHKLFNLTNVLLLVIIGLIYDNLIIAFGRFIGEGNVLESLSYARFWLHALFTPTLILFAWNICFRADLQWAKKAFWKVFAYLMTIGLILYELLTSVKGLKLGPNWKNGVLTYDSVGQSASPLMVILIAIVLAIVGILFIVKFRFYWLFIGTVIMILGSVLVIWIKNFPIMNVLEFIFIVSLLLTKQFLVRSEK